MCDEEENSHFRNREREGVGMGNAICDWEIKFTTVVRVCVVCFRLDIFMTCTSSRVLWRAVFHFDRRNRRVIVGPIKCVCLFGGFVFGSYPGVRSMIGMLLNEEGRTFSYSQGGILGSIKQMRSVQSYCRWMNFLAYLLCKKLQKSILTQILKSIFIIFM